MGIPKPNGPFPVGCADVMTNVTSLPTNLTCPLSLLDDAVDMGTFARLYYPTDSNLLSSGEHPVASLLPVEEPNLYAKGVLKSVKLSWMSFLFRSTFRRALQHAYVDAPLISDSQYADVQKKQVDSGVPPAPPAPALPLVVMSHGLYGFRNMYSAFCVELASHGFIVASVEHRDGSASPTYFHHPETNEPIEVPFVVCGTNEGLDEKSKKIRNLQVNRRADEISKLLNLLEMLNKDPENIQSCFPSKFDLTSLKGRIDVGEPLMFGHSFGGATALNVIHKDDRFKCAIALDPWFLPLPEDFYDEKVGYKKPTYHIFTERFNWGKNIKNCKRYINTLPDDFAEVSTLRHAVHVDQSDSPGFTPAFVERHFVKIPERNYEHGINVQRKIVLDYFNKYIKHKTYPVKLLTDDYTLPDDFVRGMYVYGEKEEGANELTLENGNGSIF